MQFGLDAVYMITAGKSMHGVWNLACQPPCKTFGLSAWIAVFVGLQLILSQVPDKPDAFSNMPDVCLILIVGCLALSGHITTFWA